MNFKKLESKPQEWEQFFNKPGNDDKNSLYLDQKFPKYASQMIKGEFQSATNTRYGLIKRKIEDAQVVCATCIGSTSEYLKGYQFSRVLIDEATQTTESSIILPMLNNCQQLVLIGDHKQLPPTVLSLFAQSKGLNISLFERLIRQGIQPLILNTQYRMHPSIALFPSVTFYNQILLNGSYNREDFPFIFPNAQIKVMIYHVKGQEMYWNHSYYNDKEISIIQKIMEKLQNSEIGIITTYDAQKRRLQQQIKCQVDTVDGYQGMEKDMIILSCVRSNKNRKLGFLKDPRRMNVALTRAKRGLIIVGDTETLVADRYWKSLIQWGMENKIVVVEK